MYPLPVEISIAHRVLNLILVQVRWLIGEDTEHKTLYDILDRIELLPTLLQEPARVQEFFEHVESLAHKYPVFQIAASEVRRQTVTPTAG